LTAGLKMVVGSLKMRLSLVAMMILSLTLVGCISFPNSQAARQTAIVDEKTGRRTIVENGEELITDAVAYWRDYYLKSGELEYFDTIEEAMANNLHFLDALPKTIYEIVKIFEYDNLIMLFFTSDELRDEMILYKAFALFEERGEGIYYSNFFWGMPNSWSLNRESIERLGLYDEISRMRFLVSYASALNRHSINPSNNFIWGLSQSSNTIHLRIDGQLVDGTIPVELDSQQVYFWYFEDLRPEGSLNFRNPTEHHEGQAVITMTPE
jgi:hypothetical protein